MDVWFYVDGGELFAVSFEGLSLGSNEEFLKIPRDVCPADGTPDQKFRVLHERIGVIVGIRELVFQVGKNWVRACSVDVALLKDGKVRFKATSWAHMLEAV